MTYYERNLPHWQPQDSEIFLTWRLHGSLPAEVVFQLQNAKEPTGEQFARAEKHLDDGKFGPCWLRETEIAKLVKDSIVRGADELQHYRLLAWAIMPNHIHLLIRPRVPMSKITGGIKGATACYANKIIGQTGRHFWQKESFDHWVRSAAESEKIRTYIETNPVKAGLVNSPQDWKWSSAYRPERL